MSSLIAIPEELLEQIERGNVLLFVGERVVRDTAGRAILDLLTDQLAERSGLADAEATSFPEAAQAYQDAAGRRALIQLIADQYEALGDEPQPVHRLIAALSGCTLFVTTCLDRRLERAFAEAGRQLDVVVGNVDVAFEDERKPRLYRLRGALDRVESLVLTEDDYEAFFEDNASISVVLQGYLARKTILFIGYDLADAQFKRLYRKVTAPLDDYARRAYAFGEAPAARVVSWCKRHGIDVVEADAAAFLETLSAQLRERARPKPVLPAQPADVTQLPDYPYKLLDYYESSDAGIFFGRRDETLKLSALIHGHRLVLLYGASGVGKTSLLLAGAVPLLEQADPPYTVVSVRAIEDPAQAIRRVLARRLPDATLPAEGPLIDCLSVAARALPGPLVLILDQFEEFFIRLSPQFRAVFAAELAQIYEARDVPIKTVISLREDWLAAVGELESSIPEIFRSRIRLLPLTREQARLAITAPAERLGVAYEPALVERLLNDLIGTDGAEVLPPQLQLVCNALYGRLGPNDRLITLAAYEALGGARGVLQQYLDDELARLGRAERALARGALEELVTSQGTKSVKTAAELAEALDVELELFAPVLEKLLHARLLRTVERVDDGAPSYELAHEYLIREIGLGAEAQARKQAEELIRQELENWQRFGTLLAADKLARIVPVRDSLRLSSEAQDLFFRSALQIGEDLDYWFARVQSPGRGLALLADATTSRATPVRQRAAILLGAHDTPEAVEPLIQLALHDPDLSVRTAARASLGRIQQQHPAIMARLRAEINGSQRQIRPAALRTLAALPLRNLPADLRVQVVAMRVRLRAAWLLEQSIATPLRRGLATAVGILVLLVGLAYAVSAFSVYVSSRPSPSLGTTTLVIRPGLSWMNLPGRSREPLVDTGIPVDRLANANADLERVWSFAFQRSRGGYRYWGDQVASMLRTDEQVQMLWSLNRDAGVRALADALGAPNVDASTRLRTLQVLHDLLLISPAPATPEVAQAVGKLIDDADPGVRGAAAIALGQLGSLNADLAEPTALASLKRALQDRQRQVRLRAVNALGQLALVPNPQLRSQIVELLNTARGVDDQDTVNAASQNLIALAIRSSDDQLLAEVLGSSPYYFDTLRAAHMLAEYLQAQPEHLKSLARELASYDSYQRLQIGGALGQALPPNSPALPAMIALLGDPDAQVQRLDAEVLGASVRGNPQLLERLFDLLPNSNPQVQAGVAIALGRAASFDNTAVVGLLMNRLSDSHPAMRVGAARALGELAKYPGAVRYLYSKTDPKIAMTRLQAALLLLLQDRDGEVRAAAATALGQLKDFSLSAFQLRDVVEALMQPAISDQPAVRVAALRAIAELQRQGVLTQDQITRLLDQLDEPNGPVRAATLHVLARPEMFRNTSPQLIGRIEAMLNQPDTDVRIAALQFLAGSAQYDPDAPTSDIVDRVAEALPDQSSLVRAAAASAYGQILDAKPDLITAPRVAALRSLIDDSDPDVRTAALAAISQLVAANNRAWLTAEIVEASAARLADTEPAVRRAATAAFGIFLESNAALITEHHVTALVMRLSDPNADVVNAASNVVYSLPSQAIRGKAALAAQLTELVRHGRASARPRALSLLANAVSKAPSLADPKLADDLRLQLEDPGLLGRSNLADALGALIQSNPSAARPELAAPLIEMLSSSDYAERATAASTLGLLAKAKPDLAPAVVTALLKSSNVPNRPIENLRTSLAMAVSARPDLMPQIVAEVQRSFDPNQPARVASAIGILDAIASKESAQLPALVQVCQGLIHQDNLNVQLVGNLCLLRLVAFDHQLVTQIDFQQLIALAGNASLSNRLDLIRALGTFPLADQKNALQLIDLSIDLLNDGDLNIRSTALQSLRLLLSQFPQTLGHAADAMLARLGDETFSTRPEYIRALAGLIGHDQAVDASIADVLLRRLDDPQTRRSTGQILAQLNGFDNQSAAKVIAGLSRYVADGSVIVRSYVATGLGLNAPAQGPLSVQQVEPLAQLAIDPDLQVRNAAVTALEQLAIKNSNLADAALTALAARISNNNSEVRATLADALARIGATKRALVPQATEQLLKLLADEQSGVNSSAAFALQKLLGQQPAAAPATLSQLITRLGDADQRTRYFAVGALVQVVYANPAVAHQAAGALVLRLEQENDRRVRLHIAQALSSMLDITPVIAAQVSDPMLRMMNDPSREVQVSALEVIQKIVAIVPVAFNQQATNTLVQRLGETDPAVRGAIIAALRQVALQDEPTARRIVPLFVDTLFDNRSFDLPKRVREALTAMLTQYPALADLAAESLANRLPTQLTSFYQLNDTQQLIRDIPKLSSPRLALGIISQLPLENSDYLNSQALGLTATVLEVQPESASAEVIGELNRLLKDGPSTTQAAVLGIVDTLARENPQFADARLIQTLADLWAKNGSDHESLYTTLVYLRANQAGPSADWDDQQIKRLIDPQDPGQHVLAARLLFLRALRGDQAHQQELRDQLNKLAASAEPVQRIAASRMLELLSIAEQARRSQADRMATAQLLDSLSGASTIQDDWLADWRRSEIAWATQAARDWQLRQRVGLGEPTR